VTFEAREAPGPSRGRFVPLGARADHGIGGTAFWGADSRGMRPMEPTLRNAFRRKGP
jgi:hypothetical protein